MYSYLERQMQSTNKLLESKKLNQAVQRWIDAGRRSEVYKKADYLIDGRHEKFYDAIQFIYNALNKFNQQIKFSIWIVRLRPYFCNLAAKKERSLLFCANSEEEVLSLFEGLVPKKKVEIPRSVLIKMTWKRLIKLQEEVRWTAFTNPVNPILPRDITTVKILQEILNEFIERKHHIGRKHPLVQFRKLFDLPNFTDEIVREAWKYTVIDEIHGK